MGELGYDEVDIAIVDAVRSAPRASWRDLGGVLGVDPATVSRRWSRMQSEGVAWVTAHLAGSATPMCALVEVACVSGQSRAVADMLAQDAQAATIKLTSGARDLLVLAQAHNLDALSTYLLDRVGLVPGVTNVRAHIATRSTLAASRWREGALDRGQLRQLVTGNVAAGMPHRVSGPSPRRAAPLDSADHRIVRALAADGRMSYEQLAQQVGLGPVAVRRRFARMWEAGVLTFRCDTARVLSGHTVAAVFFGSLDVQNLEEAEGRIRTLRGVRACSFVAGPYNVIIDAWLRAAGEVHDLERQLGHSLPALRVQDRSVVLRTVKLLGRVLDVEGRSVETVPLLTELH